MKSDAALTMSARRKNGGCSTSWMKRIASIPNAADRSIANIPVLVRREMFCGPQISLTEQYWGESSKKRFSTQHAALLRYCGRDRHELNKTDFVIGINKFALST